ncbi:hypothetical protein ABBQ38_006193 [Trebouxia sp. C0009 RCD-2024]
MQLTGSIVCRQSPLVLRTHLPIVLRPAVTKQQHYINTWGRRASEPSGDRCALRNTQASSASQGQQETVRPGGASETDARVAVEGDTVTVQYKCMNSKGEIIQSSDDNEPLSFEVGAGEVMGNKMFQAFDAGVRGLHIGDKTYLEASGGEWNKDLLFNVPSEHEEVQRLEGRYGNVGGLKKGLVVELSNGSNAMVIEVTDTSVQLDANNMMAGQALIFELMLVGIDPVKT